MSLSSLAYVGIRATDLDAWSDYATSLLGMQVADRSRSSLSLRMDDRKQRFIIHSEQGGGLSLMGWEVATRGDLDELCSKLDGAGHRYSRMPDALCAERFVQEGVQFDDPAGNRLEIVLNPAVADDGFVPSRAISGFMTGPLGLGHAVLTTPRLDDVLPFYQDVLGFRLSDFVLSPFKAYFFHINARHHSLALIEMPKSGTHHLMMELYHLDDVGQGYDIALKNPERLGTSLGRHTNDFMTSFYTFTPSEFMIECGWGGRIIDPNTWQPFEMKDGPSLWGHERSWLDEAGRERARDMRMSAAARGARAPVYVSGDNYQVGDIDCVWWNSSARA